MGTEAAKVVAVVVTGGFSQKRVPQGNWLRRRRAGKQFRGVVPLGTVPFRIASSGFQTTGKGLGENGVVNLNGRVTFFVSARIEGP